MVITILLGEYNVVLLFSMLRFKNNEVTTSPSLVFSHPAPHFFVVFTKHHKSAL